MKLPFSIATKFMLRMVLPGFFLAIFLLPVAKLALPFLGFAIDSIAAIPVLILLCGWLITLLDMPIYMLYEGRRYWPEWLREYFLHRESQRLSRLVTISDEHSPRTEKYQMAAPRRQRRYLRRYQEAWVGRRQFPMKPETGEYRVVAPTRLGNLIAAYEEILCDAMVWIQRFFGIGSG